MYGERRSFAPIKVGDEIEVKIEAVGAKGDGIAKIKGFVIFVPGAKEGESIKVKVTKVFRKMGFAEVAGQSTGNTESVSDEKVTDSTPEGEETEESSTDDEGDYSESE